MEMPRSMTIDRAGTTGHQQPCPRASSLRILGSVRRSGPTSIPVVLGRVTGQSATEHARRYSSASAPRGSSRDAIGALNRLSLRPAGRVMLAEENSSHFFERHSRRLLGNVLSPPDRERPSRVCAEGINTAELYGDTPHLPARTNKPCQAGSERSAVFGTNGQMTEGL